MRGLICTLRPSDFSDELPWSNSKRTLTSSLVSASAPQGTSMKGLMSSIGWYLWPLLDGIYGLYWMVSMASIGWYLGYLKGQLRGTGGGKSDTTAREESFDLQ